MYVVKFGGYDLPSEQLDMSETQAAGRRSLTGRLPGGHGEFDHMGTAPDPLESVDISKSFIIEGASASGLQTAVDAFIGEMMLSQTHWYQGARVLLALMPDATYRATYAKCTSATAIWDYWNVNQHWVPVQVTWRRVHPVWWKFEDLLSFGDHLGTFLEAAAAGYDFGGNVTEQAVDESPEIFSISNGGNARVMDGMIELDGAITNPTVANLTNGYSFTWTGSLSAGDRFTLRIASLDARKNGSRGQWSNIALGSNKGQVIPMVLEVGANQMRVTSTSPNCTFRYYWARTYAG